MMVRFVPLAVTKANGGEACIGAVSEKGEWVRPEPVFLEDAARENAPYQYFRWTAADLNPSRSSDPRPEDRDLDPGAVVPYIVGDRPPEDRAQFLSRYLDPDVETAFSHERSLGLVRARVHRVHAKVSTGNRLFFRAEFSDETGATFDWIIPELAFSAAAEPFLHGDALDPGFASDVVALLDRLPTFLTVGLTKPNHRFPGKFRGCHPLIVGIHTVPDYRPWISA